MRIQVINPNTCQGMTDKIASAAQQVALADTHIIASSPKHGPASIESAFDDVIASAALMDEIAAGVEQQVDAHIIACFGDPALDAARELATAPVIGIAEAAFHMATLVSHRFSVVTTMSSTINTAHSLLHKYGFEDHCVNVRATDIPVLTLEQISDEIYHTLLAECRQALLVDKAEAIVLGCAGMADIAARLQQDLQIPVIDGVTAAVKLAESLVQLGLKTSKIGSYRPRQVKPFIGRYQHWGAQ